MLLTLNYINKLLLSFVTFFVSVILRLDRGIYRKKLDYPVKPDNDNNWNKIRYV